MFLLSFLFVVMLSILPLRKNLLGSKCKAKNPYFACILQVLEVGKQFATANSLFKLTSIDRVY